MSFANRCMVAGANGPIILSIPLKHGRNQKALYRDLKIADVKWQSQHWKTLESCYNKSPWFAYYRDGLMELFSRPRVFLVDWNLDCFEWVCLQLGLPSPEIWDNESDKATGGDFSDFRNKLLPKNYQGFEVVKYRQVFEDKNGFQPNLSVLDLLFCEGKRAMELLRKQSG